MSRSNRNAYALIGLAVAMISLQVAAAFGVVAGANALSRSGPVVAALRSAEVVANVASNVTHDGITRMARLAGASEPAPTIVRVRASDVASFAGGDETAECTMVGPSEDVQCVGKALSDLFDAGNCESHCVMMKQLAGEISREVARRDVSSKPII